MKFSYNWLSELVEGLDAPPDELTNLITLKTAESEGVAEYGGHFSAVCAARILAVEAIEDSRNAKAIVDAGELGEKTVVCGAANCRPGLVTAYIPAGTSLAGREINKALVSGVVSEGMLASGAELGINRDHGGLMELNLDAGDSLGCRPDHIIEIDNKSLTHRPDLWGHYGMAREVSAILGKHLRDPVHFHTFPPEGDGIAVKIENLDLCPRYSALIFENLTVQSSPLWLQYRLESVGLNPINNIVDVTNYVMAEIAQPMHAFDADKLHGGIVVRSANAGETLAALNGETYELTAAHLVIADQKGPIALAGVIGGIDSAIGEGTTRIVLESANFRASSIRKTSAAMKLRTEASMRFEKAQDPANTVRGLARAVALLQDVSPGVRFAGGLTDVKRPLPQTVAIELPIDWLNRKLGSELKPKRVRSILEALEFGVEEKSAGVLTISIPSWRATRDVSIKEDFVEEVGRMIGYSSIAAHSPLLPAAVPPRNRERAFHHELRALVAAQGFHEVYNHSFLSEEAVVHFGLESDDPVRVANPIAADQSVMRTSLVPGIVQNISENSKYFDDFRLFEIGREIHKRPGSGLPTEVTHLVAAAYQKDANTEPLFALKGLAVAIHASFEVVPVKGKHAYEHPARAAEIHFHGEVAGHLFEIHPNYLKGRAAILDINLDVLLGLSDGERRYRPIHRFPGSAFDLSVIVPFRALAGDVLRDLKRLAGDLLESIEFLREYAGERVPEGYKSVSYRLSLCAADRTLSSEEVGSTRSRIIDGMRELGYELRV
ncbi:MAG: phenylalanine--tRNA ligase subunit beta [Bryobacteraceae bacterium]